MKRWLCVGWLGCLGGLLSLQPVPAQSREQKLETLSQLLKKEGEVFIAVDQIKEGRDKPCTLEDYFNNQLTFRGDSITVRLLNHTESPCERTFLRSEIDFRFTPKDLDQARLMLVQKKYNLNGGTLSEGQDSWFEIHLFTRDNQPLITRRDVADGATEGAATLRILFKSSTGAKEGIATLRSVLSATAPK